MHLYLNVFLPHTFLIEQASPYKLSVKNHSSRIRTARCDQQVTISHNIHCSSAQGKVDKDGQWLLLPILVSRCEWESEWMWARAEKRTEVSNDSDIKENGEWCYNKTVERNNTAKVSTQLGVREERIQFLEVNWADEEEQVVLSFWLQLFLVSQWKMTLFYCHEQ